MGRAGSRRDDDRPRGPLSAIAAPTLVIHGTDDPMFPLAGRCAITRARRGRLGAMSSGLAGADGGTLVARPGYLFAPHAASPSHPQYGGEGEIHYGETVITLAYPREQWSSLFTVLKVDLLLDDPYQVVVTLRRAQP